MYAKAVDCKVDIGMKNTDLTKINHPGHSIRMYSSVPNKRTGPNKCTRWNFDKNQISVQGGILMKILEYRVKTGNFINNKKDF